MFSKSFYMPKITPGGPRGGDDANFICNEEQVIGVADGVGSWWKKGIDPGKYARLLMKNTEEYVKNPQFDSTNPRSILTGAFYKTAVPGSSTACILSFDGNILRAANVGDSGFTVVKEGAAILRSPAQQRSFNCPYQLGTTSDRPEDAEEMAVVLKIGDVVVPCADGLFDNLFPEDVEETVVSPFEVAAREAGVKHAGGKYDDITVC